MGYRHARTYYTRIELPEDKAHSLIVALILLGTGLRLIAELLLMATVWLFM